jgi:alkanesulfonate monooxygenase SsuD/methylene tetrahydromethanopterin reductase-like flavin-dependent oxidoreductase (luciferase family)
MRGDRPASDGTGMTRPPYAPPGTYGLTIFSDGSGPERFRRAGEIAAGAEAAGFGTIWTSELYNRSATIVMASLAADTERCGIGCSIAYGVGRTPVVWTAEARDLDALSGGRLVLGLGNGNSRMMEDWHGVSGEAPAVRMEELVDVLRKLWRLDEGPVHHDGRFYRVHLSPPSATAPPLRDHLPIHIAGVNPRMVEVAGRVADGLISHPMFTRLYVDEVVRPAIAAGAAKTERDPADVAVIGILMCAVHDDIDVARRQIAFSIAQYAASRVYDRLFGLHGWTDAQHVIREAARQGDVEAQIAAVPEEAIELIAVACRPGELAAAVARHAGDYDHLNLTGPAWGLDPGQQEAAQLAIVERMRGALAAPA